MLHVSGLRTKAGGPIDLAVDRGEIVALRGPSGSGKSLILRAIVDLDPAEGQVELDQVSRERIAAPEWRRAVALVPAESGWWADRVGDHFADEAGAKSLLEALGLPEAAMDWEVQRLSTGERQRLAIARALALDPRVWMFDEPTASLDRDAAMLVERLIADGRDKGAAVLIVTHDADQAERLAARSLLLENGRLRAAK